MSSSSRSGAFRALELPAGIIEASELLQSEALKAELAADFIRKLS